MTDLQKIWIEGYRSVARVRMALDRITMITGPNGAGKTNLYRAIELFADASRGEFLRRFAEEGGLPTVLFAGPAQNRADDTSKVKFTAEYDDLSVRLVFGYPQDPDPMNPTFNLDPAVHEEIVWPTDATERSWLFHRQGRAVSTRDEDGRRRTIAAALLDWELGLSDLNDPEGFSELAIMRNRIGSWRFYHQFRSDHDSPLRRPQPGYRSPILHSDGMNLAATFQTIREIGDARNLERAVSRVFSGGEVEVVEHDERRFELVARIPGLLRTLSAREFSDGQLRFLCLACALLSPRAPDLLVLNEPETSLAPPMIDELADLILTASQDSQILLTTHSTQLRERLSLQGAKAIELEKVDGRTQLVGQTLLNWA